MEVPLEGETNNLIGHISSFWFLDDVLELYEVLEPPNVPASRRTDFSPGIERRREPQIA